MGWVKWLWAARILLVSFSVCGSSIWLRAQTPVVDLSADELSAMERITQADVSGTLSFLASDVLEGRGTGTRGLEVASAYVASRLRGAGAEGLGPGGSFYLATTIETSLATNAGLQVSCDARLLTASVVDGGPEGMRFSGSVERYAADEQVTYTGPVLWSLPADDWPAPVNQLRREAARLQQQGATAVFLSAAVGSPWWDVARTRQVVPQIAGMRSRYPLPIVVVDAGDQVEGSWQVDVPANAVHHTEVRNVAGVLRGSDPELHSEAILFSAHMDHLGNGAPGADAIYNGADDDASGVTAVLTLADAYAALEVRPKRSVILVGFWGEELGLLGSKHFVANSPWPLEKIVANINIEMIGRPETNFENRMWMTGWEASDLGVLVNQGSRRVGVETFEHPSFSQRLYRASDNYSFVQAGVIAHSFSAGSLHTDYHQPSDEWEKMNLPHMTHVIRGLFAGSLPLAQAELTPRAATPPASNP